MEGLDNTISYKYVRLTRDLDKTLLKYILSTFKAFYFSLK